MKTKKSKITALFIYIAVIVILCLIFKEWWIAIAVLGIMALIGYFRTRRLESGMEEMKER